MVFYEKLLAEFGEAIESVFGSKAYEDFEDVEFDKYDLIEIAKKVAFYLDLD